MTSGSSQGIQDLSIVRDAPETLRPKIIRLLTQVGKLVQIPAGRKLFTQGEESGATAYILLLGTVIVDKSDSPQIEVVGPELLGEIARLSTSGKRTATVTTADDATLVKFDWDDFNEELNRSFTPEERKFVHGALDSLAWEHTAG